MRTVTSSINPNLELTETFTFPSEHLVKRRIGEGWRSRFVMNIDPELVSWCENNLQSFAIYQDGCQWKLDSCAEDFVLVKLKFY
jgi:hypothetical protein